MTNYYEHKNTKFNRELLAAESRLYAIMTDCNVDDGYLMGAKLANYLAQSKPLSMSFRKEYTALDAVKDIHGFNMNPNLRKTLGFTYNKDSCIDQDFLEGFIEGYNDIRKTFAGTYHNNEEHKKKSRIEEHKKKRDMTLEEIFIKSEDNETEKEKPRELSWNDIFPDC